MAPDWQRALVALSATVVGAALVALLYFARALLIPVALAVLLAFVLSPVVARLHRRGLGRTTSVVTTVGLVVLVVVGIGAVIAQQVVHLANTLPDRRDAIRAKVIAAREWVVGTGNSRFVQLVDDVAGIIVPKPQESHQTVAVEPASPWAAQVDAYLSPAAAFLGQGAFAFILTVFILLRREDLRNRMIRLLGEGRVTATTRAVDDASQRISRFLLSQLLVNSTFGAIVALGLLLLGVNYPLLWGFIGTLMRYVPYIGTWVGVIPPLLYSFATAPDWGGGWAQPVAVAVLILGLEAVFSNVVEPYVYGQSMGLSQVAQLVSVAFWAFLWGPMGLILAAPLTACLLVLGRHVRPFSFLAVLLGDEPALAPRVAFYQRLAAGDQDEASDIAAEVGQRTDPETALDQVIVPALCLARRDRAEGALGSDELRFVVRAAREIGDEVSALRERPITAPDPDRVRVLLCSARDEAESVAAELFGLTLDPNRWEVKVAGDETLASELVELVGTFRPAVLVIAVLPPGGVAHARYLITRVRQRFPEVKVLVGRWGCADESDARGGALRNADSIDRTLTATRKRLTELHPVLSAEQRGTLDRARGHELVGTAGA
jgi:predicted PurR-regulated permease PerM